MSEPANASGLADTDDPHRQLKDIIEAWQLRRAELLAAEPPEDDGRAVWLRELATAHNAATRRLVRALAEESPEFWVTLRELAGNVPRVLRGDTVWDQVKFWFRDFRDSFGHRGASENWADELRQMRDDIAREENQPAPVRPRRRLRRDVWRGKVAGGNVEA